MKHVNKYLIFLLLVITIKNLCLSQNNSTDSLVNLLKGAKEDTNKLTLLLEIVESVEDDRIWAPFNEQALMLSEKLSNNKNKVIQKKAIEVLSV